MARPGPTDAHSRLGPLGRLLVACCACAALGLLPALSGCDSAPDTVLQSDLPQIPGMTGRESTGLKQSEGVIQAGHFAFKGSVDNMDQTIQETESRFSAQGWTMKSKVRSLATAKMVFMKGVREARVEIIRNELEPAMSTAVTVVSSGVSG
ncbi:MAG: hypothetical protein U0636_13360 [Phycisphaerales bacterium]